MAVKRMDNVAIVVDDSRPLVRRARDAQNSIITLMASRSFIAR
jgi:hypothetical protein